MKGTVGVALAISALVALGFVGSGYWHSLLIKMCFGVIAASSLRFSLITGQLNIGQIALVAIGAYTSAQLVLEVGVPFLVALLTAGLAAGAVGLILGLAFARARGVYYIMATLVLVEVVRKTAEMARPLTGGRIGIYDIPPPNLFGMSLGSTFSQYMFGLGLVIVCLAIMFVVERSRVGFTWKAIGEDENLAKSVGINTYKHMVLAFAFSSFFGGIAGSLFAHTTVVISPAAGFGILNSVAILMYCLIGGEAKFKGPILGAIFLVMLSEPFRGTAQYELLFFAIGLMVVVLFLPGGLITLPERLRAARTLVLQRPRPPTVQKP